MAGPNAGGVLLVHFDPATPVPSEPDFVAGGLSACDSALVQSPPDSTVLWHVFAAFPPESSPRLKVVTFGCDFDPDQVGILWSAARTGALEIRFEPNAYWPFTGSGTSVAFEETLTGLVNEIYCFAGYGADGEMFSLLAHPDSILGGSFADDGAASLLDAIAGYGALGFGVPGSLVCPAPLEEGGQGGDAPEGGLEPPPDHVEQDGGLDIPLEDPDLTFVELANSSAEGYIDICRALSRDYGFDMDVTLVPDGMFCHMDAEQRARVSQDPRVLVATAEPIANPTLGLAPGDPGFSELVWNAVLAPEPTPPDSVQDSMPIDYVHGDADNLPTGTPYGQTSIYMLGDIGVSLLLMESTDDRECDPGHGVFTENWLEGNPEELVALHMEVVRGLQGLKAQVPAAHLTFHVTDIIQCETETEPVQDTCSTEGWRLEALRTLPGMDPQGTSTAPMTFKWNNKRRQEKHLDWWFTAFIVRSVCNEGRFSDGSLGCAFSFGPSHAVVSRPATSRPLGQIFAHESIHVFGGADEYNHCRCDELCGYLKWRNYNATHDSVTCSPHVPCLMSPHDGAPGTMTLCEHSRRQIGWWDRD